MPRREPWIRRPLTRPAVVVFAAVWCAGSGALLALGFGIGLAIGAPPGVLVFLVLAGLSARLNWLLLQLLFHDRQPRNRFEALVPMLCGLATRPWPPGGQDKPNA